MSRNSTLSSFGFISQSSSEKRKDSDQEPKIENEKKVCKSTNKRKYDPSYIQFGFSFTVTNDGQLPLCVLCGKTLSNESMKPNKLRRHLESEHASVKNKPIEFFERKKHDVKGQQKLMTNTLNVSTAALRTSFSISYRIAKCKKPFTIGEELIKPCIIDACTAILGDAACKQINQIPLSNDTVTRRIASIADNIEEQLIVRIKKSPCFAIQLDESTDVANKAILLVYVRYMFEGEMNEDLLHICELPSRTTSSEVFRVMDEYLVSKELSWKCNVGICTDGAAAMTGKHSGVQKLVENVAAEDLQMTHCFIHREMLACKKMIPALHDVLSESVKIVNFIKANSLNSRLFTILCNEMGANHSTLLLHAEVRWLSRGKVLTRLYELKDEVRAFLLERNNSLAKHFFDTDWLAKLAYLSDMFGLLNDLNLSLQGPMADQFRMAHKIEAFKRKLKAWEGRIKNDVFDMFTSFSKIVDEDGFEFDLTEMKNIIILHLKKLDEQFELYFPKESDPRIGNMWIVDPFSDSENNLTSANADKLIELSSDTALKIQFKNNSLSQFWFNVKSEYPTLSEIAIKKLLPFPSSYLCETAFSAMASIKTKYRNRLNISAPLRIAVSKIVPNLDVLVRESQAQGSH